jgi:beta-N-acetylhexosaminidase
MTMMHDVNSLTDEQLAGQRLMVGFTGKVLDDDLRTMITAMGIGGLILFKRNVSDPGQLSELCQAAQTYAVESGNPPLIIAIDQEGGPVARLGPPFTVFPGNRAIGAARSKKAAREFAAVTARELKGVGITMNLAPVLDVASFGVNAVMEDRVFGEEPELVADLGRAVIETLQENGIAATAKHFPGIGRTTVDSHADLPYLEVDRQVLDASDLVPFREAIRGGVEAVMLSHVVYQDLDPGWPASLSSIIDIETTARRILEAKIDMALICHDPLKMEKAHRSLIEGVRESEDSRRKATESVQRILKLKQKYPP